MQLVGSASGQSNDIEKTIQTRVDNCKNFLDEGQFEAALTEINIADSLATIYSSHDQKAEIAHLYGNTYNHLNKYDFAQVKLIEAISEAKIAGDTLLIAVCYNDLGRMHKKNAKYSDALREFNLAKQYYYFAGDSSGIALVSLNVGNVLKSVGHSDLAKTEYHQALEYFIRNNDENNQAGCYNNLGNIFKNEGLFDSAFYYMYKTLALRQKGNSKSGLAYIYHNLANLHLTQHNTDSALFYVAKSLEIKNEIGTASDLAFDYNVYGSIYIELKQWTKAIENLEHAYSLIAEIGLSENKLDIVKQLGFAYYQNGNHKKSAENYNLYFVLNDSLQISDQNSIIQSELTRYVVFTDSIKTKQIELESNLEKAKQENTKLSNSINFRNYLYAIVILILVLALIIILFVNARRRLLQTQTHEAVLKIQNEELKRTLISKEEKEILLKEVHHRVKNNLQIINSLIRLQANFMNAKNFKEKLVETENRIRSMALIHEKLYKTGNLASLSVRNYIEELSFNILESYENHKVKIKLKFDIEEREYGIDTLIPLGLIINEVLSNSLKHAFYERPEGNIEIAINTKENQTIMTITDDGIGADLSFEELKEDSLGLELIDSLCDQLDGTISLSTENGFRYRFEFRILK